MNIDDERLSSGKFIDPIPFDGDMKKWLTNIWKHHLRDGKKSAFVGRTVVVHGSKKLCLQPGLLFFEPSTNHLKLQWYESEKFGEVFPAHLQTEFIENSKRLPPFNDDQLHYSPFIFSKSLWANGTFRMLNPAKFQTLLESSTNSPATSPSAKAPPKLCEPQPKKAAKQLPRETAASSKSDLFAPTTPNKKTKAMNEPAAVNTPTNKKSKTDSVPSTVPWTLYQCQYKSKGVRCTNEAMWCERENSKEPKYCSVVPQHKLDTAQFSYWELQGRKGFPKPVHTNTQQSEQMTEVDAEIDVQSANESDSEN